MKTHAEAKTAQPSSRAHATPVSNALSHQAQYRQALLRAGVQPRLEIGAVNDPLEREADVAAKRVMQMSEPRAPQGNLVQSKAQAAPTTPASPRLESGLNSLNGGGAPLDTSSRAFFEPRFGQDFSQVRIHTGANAAQMNESLNAKAFTLGNNIAFAPNQYSANTSTGRNLLGHELAHVVQQQSLNGGVVQGQWVQRNKSVPILIAGKEKMPIISEKPVIERTDFFIWAIRNDVAFVGDPIKVKEGWKVEKFKIIKGQGGQCSDIVDVSGLFEKARYECKKSQKREDDFAPKSAD